jgi:hypothetical protein
VAELHLTQKRQRSAAGSRGGNRRTRTTVIRVAGLPKRLFRPRLPSLCLATLFIFDLPGFRPCLG